LNSPIKWFGGKGRQTRRLLPLIPPHKVYVEPYAGGASLFFAKPPASIEVLNDLNYDIFNLYSVLRDPEAADHLRELLELTPYSQNEFDAAVEQMGGACRVEHARCFFVRCQQAFGGRVFDRPSWSRDSGTGMRTTKRNAYLNAITRRPDVHAQLRQGQIENRPALELLPVYDSPETFFYLDPPYMAATRRGGGYPHEMSDDDHRALVDAILSVKGKVMLSGYENEIYRELERGGWRRIEYQACVHINNVTDAASRGRTECVWLNYAPAQNSFRWAEDDAA